MRKNFIPPDPSSAYIALTKLMLPLILRRERLAVRPTSHCISMISKMHDVHTLLLVNHSDRFDPITTFALSKLAGEEFLYLAAREIFTGFQGWSMQKCGAYSVMRGEPEDVESKEATISLLTRGDRKLIMFPEGDVTGRDDEILPLKEDGIFNMFEAQARLVAQNRPLLLLPIAIYYEVQDDAIQPMLESVRSLEDHLGISRMSFSLESRLARVIAAYLDSVEEYYAINSGREVAPDFRLARLARRVTLAVARYNAIDVDEDLSEHVLLYTVRGQLERLLCSEPYAMTDFEIALHKRALGRAKASLGELDTMQQLLILASTLQQKFTLEAAWRIIDRLETLIVGSNSFKGDRVAWIDAGAPINLLDMWSFYLLDPHRAVSMVDRRVRTALTDVLFQLKQKRSVALVAS